MSCARGSCPPPSMAAGRRAGPRRGLPGRGVRRGEGGRLNVARLPASRRFNVHEYHRMAAGGILTEDDPVELIEGEIVEMPPMGSPHAACIERLTMVLVPQVKGLARLRVQ